MKVLLEWNSCWECPFTRKIFNTVFLDSEDSIEAKCKHNNMDIKQAFINNEIHEDCPFLRIEYIKEGDYYYGSLEKSENETS